MGGGRVGGGQREEIAEHIWGKKASGRERKTGRVGGKAGNREKHGSEGGGKLRRLRVESVIKRPCGRGRHFQGNFVRISRGGRHGNSYNMHGDMDESSNRTQHTHAATQRLSCVQGGGEGGL